MITFDCNICGARTRIAPELVSGEAGLCAGCGSTVRMRSVIRCLSLALFGRCVGLADLAPNRSIWGAGLSDWAPDTEPPSASCVMRRLVS